MKLHKMILSVGLVAVIVALSGCSDAQMKSLKDQNRVQQDRILALESDLNSGTLHLDGCSKKLSALSAQSAAELGMRDEVIAALEKDSAAKKDLIGKMQEQLLGAGVKLPMELSVMLQDFANSSDMVSFDQETGMLKFKSDLVFGLGSDVVTTEAIAPIQSLCKILNSPEGQKFDVVIVGHTDDVPIKKAATIQAHPSNWHLSVHRAISVLKEMKNHRIPNKRMSVKGFGQYRPIVENKPRKGAAENRRVEILIVPGGSM